MSARDALLNYYKKQDRKTRPKKPNKKPEFELVEKPCLKWMRQMGWDVEKSRAEATKQKWGGYSRGSLELGMTDTRGYDCNDRSFYVEFKAPGKLKNIWGKTGGANEDRQADFILKQIRRGSFAVVVDSSAVLAKLWVTWTTYIDNGEFDAAKNYLRKALPRKPNRKKKLTQINNEMGF